MDILNEDSPPTRSAAEHVESPPREFDRVNPMRMLRGGAPDTSTHLEGEEHVESPPRDFDRANPMRMLRGGAPDTSGEATD